MKMDGINKFVQRRIKNRQRLIAAVASLVFVFVFLVGGVDAADYNCTNCTNCTDTINSANPEDIVYLTQDISTTGTCIDWDNNNITFDCQDYMIDGNKTSSTYGINLNDKENNTVKNCLIADFSRGIYLHNNADFNNLENNTVKNNLEYGIYLLSSDSNNLINNSINNNSMHGIYISNSDSNKVLGNRIINNGHSGSYDGIYFTENSNSSNLTGNVICFNTDRDIDSKTDNNDGDLADDNNTCDNTKNWADPGTGNCTFHCNPEINSSNSSGLDDEFDTGVWVYAYSDKLARKNVSVCVCIVSDTNWSDGDDFNIGKCYSKTTNGSGNLNASIWKPIAGDAGNYDMVLDIDCDGRYDAYRDDVDSLNVGTFGFYIYPEAETLVLFSFGLFVLYGFIRFGRKSKL
ncbi:hypothetical protein BEH94_08240 [Candidatus Altiarchaeales archaeon WOR_SM1_SCG]|nr:hypothetical protein BEH94_08240 [Candidatus Altiarchaeales archaeon WOR_SM1_SCG]